MCSKNGDQSGDQSGGSTESEPMGVTCEQWFYGFGSMWESCSVYTLVYGTLKHSPAFAMSLVIGYSSFRALLMVFINAYDVGMYQEKKLKEKDAIEPVSVYTDIHQGAALHCVAVFTVQVMLYLFMLLTVYSQQKYDEDMYLEHEGRPTTLYVCGAIISTVVRSQDEGFLFGECRPFWQPYFCCDGFENEKKQHCQCVVYLRLLMSVIVNEILANAALFLLPTILMVAPDYMEFVKDATCIMFISKLDTLPAIEEDQKIKKG